MVIGQEGIKPRVEGMYDKIKEDVDNSAIDNCKIACTVQFTATLVINS